MEDNTKTFKILSIDGGGINGIYSLYILKALEAKYCKNDKTLSDYFDMICGTSTGGLIALGLADKRKVNDIIELYEKKADIIFPGHNNFFSKLTSFYYWVFQLLGYKYNNTVLKNELTSFFGNKTLGQSNNLLCIPSFNLTNGTNIVFKYPHKQGGYSRDQNILMKDVALATSAPPTYMPMHYFKTETINGYFLDGGIWANNPTLVGITETLDHFVGKDKQYQKYDVLSIGSYTNNHGTQPSTINRFKWFNNFYWGFWRFPKLLDIMFDSNRQSVDKYCDIICKNTQGRLTRIADSSPSIYVNQNGALDNTNNNYIDALISASTHKGSQLTAESSVEYKQYDLQRFFTNQKTYKIQNDL